MNAPVAIRDPATPFDPAAFRARLNGSILASSEALDWPGLLIVKAHLEAGESIAPAVTDNTLCLGLSGARGRLERRLTGERPERSWCQIGDAHITPARREALWLGDQPCDALLMFLREPLFSRIAREVFDLDPANVALQPRFGVRDPTIEHIGRLLLNELETPAPGGRLFVESLANTLAVHLLRNHSAQAPAELNIRNGLSASRLKRVIDYIEAHLEDGLSLEQMAELAGYSTYHFSRLFKQATQRSPHQFVVERRIQRARELLKHSKASAAEIAFELGFSSQSHFAAAFKKMVGVTPGRYQSS